MADKMAANMLAKSRINARISGSSRPILKILVPFESLDQRGVDDYSFWFEFKMADKMAANMLAKSRINARISGSSRPILKILVPFESLDQRGVDDYSFWFEFKMADKMAANMSAKSRINARISGFSRPILKLKVSI